MGLAACAVQYPHGNQSRKMAGSSTLSDVVFLTDPPESLVCLICLSVADKPQQINCCGTVFCDSCLTQYMDLRDECPHCRQEGDPFDDKRSKSIS